MDFSIARFTAFCLIFAYATSAPTGHSQGDACDDVRESALEFNSIARDAAKSGPKGIKSFSLAPVWMEAHDRCDPETLRSEPAQCIKKLLDVLTSYKSFVKIVAEFESCTVAHKVMPVLLKLHHDMSKCVKSRTEYHHQNVNPISEKGAESGEPWHEELLCHYTMERLFSFSILTARVFSMGDPANHAEPTALKCTQSS